MKHTSLGTRIKNTDNKELKLGRIRKETQTKVWNIKLIISITSILFF